jgi:hypothetical protein
MSEFPLSYLTHNLYQDIFGFFNRYDCAKLLTVNKEIAEDVSKYVASTSFVTPLYYEKDHLSYITTKGESRPYSLVESITLSSVIIYKHDPFLRNPTLHYTIWVKYKYGAMPWQVLSVSSKQEADNIIYDFAAFKKHKAFCEKRALEKQEELVRKTKRSHYFIDYKPINPPWRQTLRI